MLHFSGEGRTHSFSLSSSLKSAARTRAGSAKRAPAFLNDGPVVDEGEGIVLKLEFAVLLADCSEFDVLNIGVGLITLTALIFCIDEAVDFISFCAVWVDTKGETLRGNIFVCV